MLLKGFLSFLRFVRQCKEASEYIYTPLMVHIIPFLQRLTLELHTKTPDLKYPLRTGNGILHWNEIHPLLLKCFITFIRCMVRFRGSL